MFGRVFFSRSLVSTARGILSVSGQSTAFKAAVVSTNILPKNNFHTSNLCFSDKAPMTKAQIESRIKLVLGCFDKVKKTDISMDDDLFKDLGLDSLDHVELVCSLEEEFNFSIPEGIADEFKTPRDIFQFICDKEDVFE
ncbi:Acyl carrier protein, mitochondrial [Strongyloides ratti]|uniref:Acyl carrier protein n=1 Tax=Strongyloides ratti TaxID=34506 RepID=A0A090LNM7_STRRB|nr:Acyl carrier protein, mitochondrial [Strongyloides ratti]CEF69130.1 Acyl carrier protein, mitochondrial [Strongyloides ratti]